MVKQIVSVFVLIALSALLLTGCGSGSSSLRADPSASTGKAMLTINWPALSRLIPVASNSISITLTKAGGFSASQIVNRPINIPPTSTVIFNELPTGTLTVTATAYPLANATGTAQATGTAPLLITDGQVATLVLTMNSTITQVIVTPSTPAIAIAGVIQLSAAPENSANNLVLVALGNITWASLTPTVATVNPATGQVTGVTAGSATITATESDSLVVGNTVVTVQPGVAVTVSPKPTTVAVSTTKQFTAIVTGTANTTVTWTVVGGNANGTITAAGLYTAPSTGGAYQVTATSVADPTKSDTATVTVPPVVVTMSPATTTLAVSTSQQFTATLTGTANQAVIWTVVGGNANGTITATGLYTAPSTGGSYTVTATSVADPTVSNTATITVPPVVVTINLTTAIDVSATEQVTTSVTGTANTAVTWTVVGGNANGTITAAGLYAAPAIAGNYQVKATSMADPTVSNTATITVQSGNANINVN